MVISNRFHSEMCEFGVHSVIKKIANISSYLFTRGCIWGTNHGSVLRMTSFAIRHTIGPPYAPSCVQLRRDVRNLFDHTTDTKFTHITSQPIRIHHEINI